MEYIRTFTREFEAGEQAELSIENHTGTATVRGTETGRVRVEVVARLWAESEDEADGQVELIERGIRQEGKRVTVRAPLLARPGLLSLFGRGPRIDYQVTTPCATRAQIINRTGRVEVENLTRPLEVEVRSGRVSVHQIAADTTITSGTGAIEVESIKGSLEVKSRTGMVRVSHCTGDVTVRARTGSTQIEDVEGKLQVETRTGAVRYAGEVHGAFDIDVRTGSVRLAVDPNSIFFLDAESTTGSVRSDLPLRRNAGAASAKERGPTVRVRTRTGSIRIVPR